MIDDCKEAIKTGLQLHVLHHNPFSKSPDDLYSPDMQPYDENVQSVPFGVVLRPKNNLNIKRVRNINQFLTHEVDKGKLKREYELQIGMKTEKILNQNINLRSTASRPISS